MSQMKIVDTTALNAPGKKRVGTPLEIQKLIDTKKTFSIGRMPGIESYALLEWCGLRKETPAQYAATKYFKASLISEETRTRLETNTGFYCREGDYDHVLQYWCEKTLEGLRSCDLLFRLETGESKGFDCLVSQHRDSIHVWSAVRLHEWLPLLQNKKVLVISPFEDSIKMQWPNRKKLFSTSKIAPSFEFPDFELKTVKTHNTIRGNEPFPCGNWRESFESMCREIKDIDFDIAIVGCGGYGMPIVNYIKNLGKASMYVGSYVQVMFGIMGSRWNVKGNTILGYSNEFWKTPEPHEIPKSAGQVENGCYWLNKGEIIK